MGQTQLYYWKMISSCKEDVKKLAFSYVHKKVSMLTPGFVFKSQSLLWDHSSFRSDLAIVAQQYL